jgi:hypothetical protein
VEAVDEFEVEASVKLLKISDAQVTGRLAPKHHALGTIQRARGATSLPDQRKPRRC